MSAVAELTTRPAAAQTATLRTLAGIEARRYARHPLFAIGLALMVWVMAVESPDLGVFYGDTAVVPALFLGLFGVLVGVQLTRSMARSDDAVEATPTDGIRRTAALCLACLVPGAVSLVWAAWIYVALAVWPLAESTSVSSGDRAATIFAGVVFAVGGPLFGVLVGRWTRFSGAGLVGVLVLVGWCLLGTIGVVEMSASRLANLVHLNAPFALWASGGDGEPDSMAGGSPGWYLVYVTALCGLAATAAMLHEAQGAQRTRLVRALVAVAGIAAVSLALAVLSDPTRIPL